MDDEAARTRMSRALLWGWLALGVGSLAWQLYSRTFVLSFDDTSFEAPDWELYGQLAQVYSLVVFGLWGFVLYGLWHTARTRDSGRLRFATYGLGLQVVFDLLIFVGMRAEWVDPAGDTLEYAYLLVGIAGLAGGLAIVGHAAQCGVAGGRLVLPVIGQLLSPLLMVLNLFGEGFVTELGDELAPVLFTSTSLLYWFGWATLPKHPFALGEEGSEAAAHPVAAPSEASASDDILAGILWAGGGILLTVMSFSGGGIGGRAVLAYGPIIYGLFRLFRGLSRRES